jgi:hypothetical protein
MTSVVVISASLSIDKEKMNIREDILLMLVNFEGTVNDFIGF